MVEEQYTLVEINGDVIGDVTFNSRTTDYNAKALICVEIDDTWGDKLSDRKMINFALDRLYRHKNDYGPVIGIHSIRRTD